MYKVMLIDDECVIRQGLKKIIDWQAFGFLIVDEAENGISAYEKILEQQPDLLLLDIRMPGYDGVTLLKMIRKKGLNCKVIFLTGFAEFEYAQEAIVLNVEAFLTKPIDEIELQQYLTTTKLKLDKEKMINDRLTNQLVLEEKQLYRRLLFGQKLNDVTYQNKKGLFTVVEIQFSDNIEIANAFFDNYQKTNEQVVSLLVAGSWVLIFKELSLSRIKVALYDLSMQMEKQFKDYYISVGRQVNGYHTLYNSFQDANTLGQRWFLDNSKTINYYYEKFERDEKHFIIDSDLLFGYIEVNNIDGVNQFFEILEDNIWNRNMNFSKVKGLCVNCLLIIIERIQQYTQLDSKLPENHIITDEMYQQTKLSQLIQCMKKYITIMLDTVHDGSRESTMTRLLDYISKHYEKDLKLERLGSIFGYNSSYLGTIFKQHTGMSYSKYLDSVRIDEAKRLLLEDNNKVYEIAQLVGFNSVDYFHGKFKKYVHMSPKQFQLEHRQSTKGKGE